MKIALSLIKEFISIDLSAQEIAQKLTLAGIEVENIENENPSFTNVVVAKVEEVEKHPKADKLTIAKVNDGKEIFQVVCGAPNCKKGMITAFAKIGATLTTEDKKNFEIKKAKLRDVESFGMLCSAEELNISYSSEGILDLPQDIEIGKDLSELFCDPIFDISLTPNLGHCMSALGIARELAAILDIKVKYPTFPDVKVSKQIQDKITINIEDIRCKRYACSIVENVKIGPSPFWLTNILESSGIRSINNVVDIINYIMLKYGQPMHAFDLNKIENNKIRISSNKDAFIFEGLDGIERTIPKNSINIYDDKKVIAIAGIMGSNNSSVDDATKNILIEAAYFDDISVGKTSRALALRTESSLRFEKGIDPNMIPIALQLAASLIQEICQGTVIKGIVDEKEGEFLPKKISCRLEKTNKVLGSSFSISEIESLFKRLEFSILSSDENQVLVEVPTYRNDISKEIDLIEEVIRIYGYNNLPKHKAKYSSSNISPAPSYLFEKDIKAFLRSQGLQEFITSDLISPDLANVTQEMNFRADSFIHVKHSKSIEQSVLRPSLLSNLLQIVKFNHDHKSFNIAGYEVGRIYFKKQNDFIEQNVVSIVLSGSQHPLFWGKKLHEVSFFDLKGILENIFEACGIKKSLFKSSNHPVFHPGRQANIIINNIDIGVIGEVHPFVLSSFDIKKRVLFAEINLNFLLENKKEKFKFAEYSLFPSSERDLTITLKENVPISSIFKIIEENKSNLLEHCFLLDLYKATLDEKNVTFRFVYRDKSKTICFEDVEKEHKKITTEITKNI